VYLALQAVSIWLDQYATVIEQKDLMTGATFADVNATIPGRAIIAGIAALVAVLAIVTAVIGRWRLPIIGTALLIVSGLLVGSIYPALIRRFQVEPSEQSLEAPYLRENIDSTREAYGVADLEVRTYQATTDAAPGALREDAETTANIRLVDPAEISPT